MIRIQNFLYILIIFLVLFIVKTNGNRIPCHTDSGCPRYLSCITPLLPKCDNFYCKCK
uniref:Nodule-specific cysteine-rich peptide L34 n=1 Tax=Lens culinaris TaxID=3864 RepID=A0A7T8DVA0_LENCU|nr:nodule-specific cysteine-rich peptide L34 [Lens culinaris]